MTQQQTQGHVNKKYTGFPWRHVIGFALSIVLTLLAVWTALYTDLAAIWILTVIFAFAILQAVVQLLMFMHLTETSNGQAQVTTMLHALFIFIIIVAGSVWVMLSVIMY